MDVGSKPDLHGRDKEREFDALRSLPTSCMGLRLSAADYLHPAERKRRKSDRGRMEVHRIGRRRKMVERIAAQSRHASDSRKAEMGSAIVKLGSRGKGESPMSNPVPHPTQQSVAWAISRMRRILTIWETKLHRVDKEYILRRIRDNEPDVFYKIAQE